MSKKIYLPLRRWGALVVVTLSFGAWTGPDAPLADAAMQGAGTEAARELLRAGADVNAAQGDGMTALHWAARNGDAQLTSFLLDSGGDLRATTRLGAYTPLHLASEAGRGPVIRILLAAGADPNQTTTSGGAGPLHLAARAGSVEGVTALISHRADANLREAARGQTPLMFAAASGRSDVVRVLTDGGADLSISTRVNDVPALTEVNRLARRARDSVLVAFRDQAGENSAWRPSAEQVQAAARAGWKVRNAASVEAGSESHDQEGFYADWPRRVGTWGGLTALLYAVREGHEETVVALLDAGADINQVGAGDRTSPLLMAAIHGWYDLAMVLLDRGADPNIRNTSGDQPLFATVETRWTPATFYPGQHFWMDQETTHLDLLEALLMAGADPDARLTTRIWYSELNRSDLGINFVGSTAFFRAAHALDLKAMKLLVAYGADPNIPTLNPNDWDSGGGNRSGFKRENDKSGLPPVDVGGPGAYPIHAASGVGHGQAAAGNAHRHEPDGWMAAVRYLVEEHGVDVNMRDHGGYAPIHNAAARGDNEMIMYLVEQGADVTVVSRRGHTTADMANSPFITLRPIPETIALLEDLGSYNNNVCLACGDAERGGR